jgi:predicted lipid-binding transport protein (Tim44 family)
MKSTEKTTVSGLGVRKAAALFMGLFLAFSLVSVDHADARRGGSFGSRGTRTFQVPAPTRTAPQRVGPLERTTTPNTTAPSTSQRQQTGAYRQPGFFNGFGGSLMRGLFIGGLFGLLLGHGFGGLAGVFGFLFQVLLVVGGIWLVMRLFRSAPSVPRPAYAGAGAGGFNGNVQRRDGVEQRPVRVPGIGSAPPAAVSQDIRLDQADLNTFERRLTEVQEAFGREDFAALRRYATPEMVSYLSEELADNAKRGVHNEVSDVRLLQADIAESWREGADDYATAAMLYQSRDVTRDRKSGRVVDGTDGVSETTELWTFRRQNRGDWKLSAIQQA